MLYPARAHAFFRLMNDEDACLDVRHVSTVLYGAEHAESALQPNAELDVEAAKAVVGAPVQQLMLVQNGTVVTAPAMALVPYATPAALAPAAPAAPAELPLPAAAPPAPAGSPAMLPVSSVNGVPARLAQLEARIGIVGGPSAPLARLQNLEHHLGTSQGTIFARLDVLESVADEQGF